MSVMPAEIRTELDTGAIYEIARTADGWTIFHDGRCHGSLNSKIAAWDAAVAAAFPLMLAGSSVVIKVAANAEADQHIAMA